MYLSVPTVIFVIDCSSEGSHTQGSMPAQSQHARVQTWGHPGRKHLFTALLEFTSYFDSTTEITNNNYNSCSSWTFSPFLCQAQIGKLHVLSWSLLLNHGRENKTEHTFLLIYNVSTISTLDLLGSLYWAASSLLVMEGLDLEEASPKELIFSCFNMGMKRSP